MALNIKFFDVQIVKDFCASFKDFLPVALKPGVGKPTEDPAVLQKNLVTAMWVIILAHAVNIVYYALGASISSGIRAFISNSIGVLIFHWLTWFAYVKREPNCCFGVIFCIEDWKFQHLIWGVISLFMGVAQCFQSVDQILRVALQCALLDNLVDASGASTCPTVGDLSLGAIFLYVGSGIMFVYGVIMILVAISLIKIGGKKAGIEIPDPAAAVGKTEEANPAESA